MAPLICWLELFQIRIVLVKAMPTSFRARLGARYPKPDRLIPVYTEIARHAPQVSRDCRVATQLS